MIKVIKRDGRTVDFDWSKITDAILKAYCDVYRETNHYPSYCIEIAKNIEEVARECDNVLTVEDIQDSIIKPSGISCSDSVLIYLNKSYADTAEQTLTVTCSLQATATDYDPNDTTLETCDNN